MTPLEIENLLQRLQRGETTARAVIAQLIADGYEAPLAIDTVHVALGGGDLVDIGADGRERYYHSGRLVTEVEAEMKQ